MSDSEGKIMMDTGRCSHGIETSKPCAACAGSLSSNLRAKVEALDIHPGTDYSFEAVRAFRDRVLDIIDECLPDETSGNDDATKLRRLLAFCYSSHRLYLDDGEMQDNSVQPFIDWQRDS